MWDAGTELEEAAQDLGASSLVAFGCLSSLLAARKSGPSLVAPKTHRA